MSGCRYSATFWERGPDELTDWEKHKQKIEEGERKREKLQDMVLAVTLKCKQHDAPLFEMDLEGLLPPAQVRFHSCFHCCLMLFCTV